MAVRKHEPATGLPRWVTDPAWSDWLDHATYQDLWEANGPLTRVILLGLYYSALDAAYGPDSWQDFTGGWPKLHDETGGDPPGDGKPPADLVADILTRAREHGGWPRGDG